MKTVIYSDNKKFILTNQEFMKAATAWAGKQSFYCSRLEALLSPFYKYVETNELEVGHEIFLWYDCTKQSFLKIYKRDSKYFVEERNQCGESKLYPYNLPDKVRATMIKQEDYYSDKLYLK